jgi:hypothetical protein
MNTSQLERIFEGNKGFIGVFPSNLVPPLTPRTTLQTLIVNLDPSYKPGSHWIAITIQYKGKPIVEYFDSYGLPPQVNIGPKKNLRLVYNTKRLQKLHTKTCGHFCVYLLKRRLLGLSFDAIIKKLDSLSDPDKYVEKYIKVHFPKTFTKPGKNHQCCHHYKQQPTSTVITLKLPKSYK